jgi:glycosyltransferase involved in cell wall biosynthesis
VSYWLTQFIPDSILSHFNVKVIQNGIDLNVFQPTPNRIREKFNIPNNKIIVLGVLGSGFGVEKGKKEFIELAKCDDIQIILVGLTNDDFNDIPENIIKIGRTSSQMELAEFYSAADIFLNPTYNDTFPTTNIEAMACGTPSVAYKTGGCSEIIDESTGILVEKGDYKGLLTAIGIIKKNGKTFYARACRNRAVANFNKDERFLDYIKLYEELLNRK